MNPFLAILLFIINGIVAIFLLRYAHKCIIAARDAFKELKNLKDKFK